MRRRRTIPSRRHSERCAECKTRVGQLLERIYGTCVPNYRFGWQTGLAPYAGTSIGSVLRDVAGVLEEYRGYGIGTFVRSDMLAGCDYWVPDPGFIVEFDESQHFTSPRKRALSVYADTAPLGFSAERWTELCGHHDARDNHPRYRDEQRAWYDTLRDLVPSIMGLQPTVRLYARDWVWCSLDPDSREDRKTLLGRDPQGEGSVQSSDGGNPLPGRATGIDPAARRWCFPKSRRGPRTVFRPAAPGRSSRRFRLPIHSPARPSTSCFFPKATYPRPTRNAPSR